MMCKQLFGYFLALALIFGLMAGLPAMDAAEDEPWIKVDFTAGNPDGYALTSSEVDTAGAYFAFDDYVEPHFTIPESDLAEGAETATGLKMYYHGNGFYFRPPADLFAEDDAVFIDIEWYWPGKKTQDQTRVNAEAGSGSYNKVFGDNGVSRDRLQGETGGDVDTACTFQWRGDLAATKLYLGNDNKGIHFMLWHSQNWSPEMDLPTYEEQYVVILSVTYRAVPVYGSRLDWSELLRLINDGGGNNELKTLYYDGAETYKEALAEAKALYASRFDGNRIIPLRFPADLTYVLTQHHIDAAVDKLKASNAFLTVKPDVYTLTNARFGEMSHVDPDLPLSGFVTTVGGYNCWAVRGDNKYFPLYEMGNILDGEKAVKFEISYLIEGWYGNNSRFYPGYPKSTGYIGAVDPPEKNGDGTYPHDDWNQIIYGYDQDYLPLCTRVKRDGLPGQPGFEVVFDEWCTVTLEFDGEDNIFDNQNGPQDGPIAGALVSILNRGPEGENVYIRSLRVWATDQPEREVSVVFGKTGVIPPYSIRDELKVWIDRCSALDPNDFVQDDKWMTMQIRLSEAIALYDYWSIPRITIWPPNPPPPTEYELMVALNRLISAYKALTPIKNPGTDRTFLDAAVSAAKKKQDEADFEEYCNLSKFNLAAALAAGENLYWDSDQEEIDAAADAITAALASNTAMRLKGDIDGDGEITVSDVRAVLQHVVGKAEITDPLSLSAAKVDGAGETVGIGDARMILQKLVGKIEDWP